MHIIQANFGSCFKINYSSKSEIENLVSNEDSSRSAAQPVEQLLDSTSFHLSVPREQASQRLVVFLLSQSCQCVVATFCARHGATLQDAT